MRQKILTALARRHTVKPMIDPHPPVAVPRVKEKILAEHNALSSNISYVIDGTLTIFLFHRRSNRNIARSRDSSGSSSCTSVRWRQKKISPSFQGGWTQPVSLCQFATLGSRFTQARCARSSRPRSPSPVRLHPDEQGQADQKEQDQRRDAEALDRP